MFILFLSFKKVFNANLLFYSWNCLKKQNSFLILSHKQTFGPISHVWFRKTSLLINSGNFIYKKFNVSVINRYNYKKRVLSCIKFRVIENAFLYLLEPYFKSFFSRENLNRREYVCLLNNE